MKYKRQLMSGMVALALVTSGASVFAADTPTKGSKILQQTNQVKMKSNGSDGVADSKDRYGKDLETKDDVAKKVSATKHKKTAKTHKVKTVTPVTKPVQ